MKLGTLPASVPPASVPPASVPPDAVHARRGGAPTRREANKLDKLRRIQHAAHKLFVQQGFDNTTMREIATRAEVALGTLFLYASNKRDLLFLIANDIMVAAAEEAAALVGQGSTLTEDVVLIAGVHFRVFGEKPKLFRLVLREMLFYDSGVQATRAAENRQRVLALIQQSVEHAAQAGEVGAGIDPPVVAHILFAVVQAEVRRWIASEQRALATGIASCWTAASVVVGGLKHHRNPVEPQPAAVRKMLRRLEASQAKRDRPLLPCEA